MQTIDKRKRQESSALLRKKRQFQQTLNEFRAKINVFDQNFLHKLNQILQLKHSLFSEEVSSLVIVISLAAMASKNGNLFQKQQTIITSLVRVQQLYEYICEQKTQACLHMIQPEMVRKTTNAWNQLVRSSCYRNHTDLMVLYYFIGNSLFESQKQLKRLTNLILLSFSKIKQLEQDTLTLTLFMITHFLKLCEMRKFSFELKVQLNILNILYLSKIQRPNEQEFIIIKKTLEKFINKQLQHFIDHLNEIEQLGILKQENIIWDRLFSAVIRSFYPKQQLHAISKQLLIQMLNFRIDMQTVKLMIRQLEVSNEINPLEKWKQIFELLNVTVRIYDRPKEAIMFTTSKSYMKIPMSWGRNFLFQIQLKNSWKTYEQQKFLIMIQDKNRKDELWITTINQRQGELKIMLLRVLNQNILEQTQQYILWNQNTTSKFLIKFSPGEITIQINELVQNTISIQRFMDNPSFLVVGDEDGALGTSIKSFISLSVAPNNYQQNLACYRLDLSNKAFKCEGLRKKIIPSFVQIFKALGDIDLFLLISSHVIKKMKTDPIVTNMLRASISLLEGLVAVKQVTGVQLRPEEREERLNAIVFLCWQCSHETKNALAVLELLRVITIRGVPNPQDELQLLCNFVFWKEFQWQYQRLIIMKIMEIFMEYRLHENYLKQIHKYCKRILMEAILYYRQEDALNSIDDKNRILRIHFQFLTLVQKQMVNQINIKKDMDLLYEFIEFLIKILSLTVSRKNQMGVQTFDLTTSIEISYLALNIGKLLEKWSGKEEKLFRLIKCVTDVCKIFEAQQWQFQQKKLRIFQGQEGFKNCSESQIKENLYFLAYKLVSLYPGLLFLMAELEEKEMKGIPEITCIGWQRQFFDKILLSKDKQILQNKLEDLLGLRQIFERLPLKYLSIDQNKFLLKIYLKNDKLFPKVQFKLSSHFWKLIGIKQILETIKSELFINAKQESQITQTSKFQENNYKNLTIFKNKVFSLLAVCQQLSGIQGLVILKTVKLLYPPTTSQFLSIFHHFILKHLTEQTKRMTSSIQQPSLPFNSQIDVSPKYQTSQISAQDSPVFITLQELIRCIEYYLTQLNAKDVMQFKGISIQEEAQVHLQNYKIQLTQIINYLSKHQMNGMNQLKKYYHFLEAIIMPLSKYYLQVYGVLPNYCQFDQRHRKKSKHFIQFPKFDLKEEAKNMYFFFFDERNQNLLKVQKVWSKIQERNKYFWNTFLPRQIEYTLYQGTGALNERYLLKKTNKKQKVSLPRMHRASIMKSASIMSQKFQFNQSQSSIFDDAHLYRKDSSSCLPLQKHEMPAKQGRMNKFNVFLITSSKIYQGTLVIIENRLIFTENETINGQLYKKIIASQCQQRNQDQCIRENLKFQEQLSNKCTAVVKRYLFHDIALELHTNNRSYLFSFLKRDHRIAFTLYLHKTINMKVITREQMNQQLKNLAQKWVSGEIGNYHYLMKVNDLSGRSFNDLSQYYVFPWVVSNFKSELNLSFFKTKQNFRDLSVPVGKLSKSKWENIKKNYQRTKKDDIPGIKPFLFGSFYSNPAIVSNFLIRINPFASQHFELQSHQFDLADRLFYSIEDSYRSLNLCSSDFKELIPEFYFFSEFLKNRNFYNLGSRQNKDIVDNVGLPVWAQDEYQFVFRMRKILQSGPVTSDLHFWIDLIFGVYSKKEYALKADNLFLDNLYIDSFKANANDKYQKDKEYLMYFKQFGQVPVSTMTSNHRPSKVEENHLDLLSHRSMKMEECQFQSSSKIGRLIQICFSKKYTILLFEKQLRMYSDEKFSEKQFLSIQGDFQEGTVKVWEMIDEKSDKSHCVLVYRKKTNQLLGYKLKSFLKMYSFEGGDVLQFKHKIELFTLYDNMIICSQGKNINIYKNIQDEIEEDHSSRNFCLFQTIAKKRYLLAIGYQIAQHKSRVIFVGTTERGMIVSIDQECKVFIVDMHSNTISIYNYFQIRNMCLQEKIDEVLIHNYGFIIIRTTYQRLLMFTFLGDKVVNQLVHFKKQGSNPISEEISTMTLWNQDFPQLILGTNIGNIWKIDLFAIRKQEQITETQIWIQKIPLSNSNKEGYKKDAISKIGVNRIGRHSLTLVSTESNKLYVIKSERWDEIKKCTLSRLKNAF